MPTPDTSLARLTTNWVYGGSIAGLLLLALLPTIAPGWSLPHLLAFLTLPAYMLHQFEEHDDDRFRRFVNTEIGHGKEVLKLPDVFVINIVFVWFLLAAVIYAAFRVNTGWGAMAGWLIVVNGLLHLAPTLRMRRYNPGLVTGVILFLPLGIATLLATPASLTQQAISLALVLLLHAGIVALVLSRRSRA